MISASEPERGDQAITLVEGTQIAEWRTYRPVLPVRRLLLRGIGRYRWAGMVAVVLLVAIAAVIWADYRAPAALCLLASVFIGGALLASGFVVKDEDLLRLRDLPNPEGTFLVDLAVEQDGISTGEDSGVVSFVDGWMVYEGLRTSFSVSALRCQPSRRADGMVLALGSWQGCAVDAGLGTASVFYKARQRDESLALTRAISGFLAGPKPNGSGIAPPLGLAPGVLVGAKWQLIGSYVPLSMYLLAGIAVAASAKRTEGWLWVAIPLLFCTGVVSDTVRSLSRYRKLAKIASLRASNSDGAE